jgi:hypothetical protein
MSNLRSARPDAVARPESCRCQSCSSVRLMEFRGEICLHFSGGLESLNKPLVWMLPQVVVCLDCGATQFTIPDEELKVIQENA